MSKFVHLLNCTFQHEYYLSEGMPVEVVPTTGTQALLNSAQCIFRSQNAGFQILVQVEQSKADSLQALFEFEPDAELQFNVRVIDRNLYNFSKPLIDPHLENRDEHEFASSEELDEFWKKNKEIRSRVFFRVQNSVVEKTNYPVPDSIKRTLTNEVLCAITIPLREFGIAPFQHDFIPEQIDIHLPFESRQTRWCYTLKMPELQGENVGLIDTSRNTEQAIIFEEQTPPGISSAQPALDDLDTVRFISKQKISLKSRPDYRFSLIIKDRQGEHVRTLIDRLPMANSHNFSKDPQNDSDLVSDIYIS